ncbi:MAG: SOS response-associated peptidase [Planctomycetaceae bacterium]|nr:SOS response-associated peptidase [Planctomycetaceae bacterium]MCB9951296.1 SOS response-associated peptidase [Planctomycetaceae bacterium]
MCGRYNLKTSQQELREVFDVLRGDNFQLVPRYNIAPTQPVLIVRMAEQPEREFAHVQWGLIPSWAKDPNIGAKMINARSETVQTKPAFRAAFKRRRCLIPANGFYEWKQQGRSKQPHLIQLQGEQVFGFAGLWETWCDPEGGELSTCTIITTAANELLQPLHERMPVILRPEDHEEWLTCPEEDIESLHHLMGPFPSQLMQVREVDAWVNSARHEGPRCEQSPARGLFD